MPCISMVLGRDGRSCGVGDLEGGWCCAFLTVSRKSEYRKNERRGLWLWQEAYLDFLVILESRLMWLANAWSDMAKNKTWANIWGARLLTFTETVLNRRQVRNRWWWQRRGNTFEEWKRLTRRRRRRLFMHWKKCQRLIWTVLYSTLARRLMIGCDNWVCCWGFFIVFIIISVVMWAELATLGGGGSCD